MKIPLFILTLALSAAAPSIRAQTTDMAYGPSVSLDDAKRIVKAAEAEAVKNNWKVVIAVVDTGGHLVLFQRMDGSQLGSIEIAQGKAYTAVAFRRPSKAFQEALGAGGEALRSLKTPGLTPLEGGLPLVAGGKVIGAIGVSGVTSAQDAQIGGAGAAVLK
jgi:uncharacterized protein GlcG (DUF336 family)